MSVCGHPISCALKLVAAWALCRTEAPCGLGLAAGGVPIGVTEQGLTTPVRRRAAGRQCGQSQPGHWGPPWGLAEARLGVRPRSGPAGRKLEAGRANGDDER